MTEASAQLTTRKHTRKVLRKPEFAGQIQTGRGEMGWRDRDSGRLKPNRGRRRKKTRRDTAAAQIGRIVSTPGWPVG